MVNYMKSKKILSFMDLNAQQKRLNNKITKRINNVLDHGKYIMGPEVKELEMSIKNYTNAKHVISCANGTDALLLALMAYKIGPGDAVFCPTFTFPATAEVISLLGATPIFVDVDKNTFNICENDLKNAISFISKNNQLKMKAIIAVDLYGLPANYKSLKNIANENNLYLIADAAQSFGASYENRKVGTLADITCISFFPAKPLGCYGDGGALICDDKEIANNLQSLRVHGKGNSKYEINHIGLNSRLDTIQAAILLAKLEEFDWEVSMRNKIATKYTEQLNSLITTPILPNGSDSVWAQYTLKHEKRDHIQKLLNTAGVPSMVYYPIPMHMQNAYKKYNIDSRALPNAEYLSKNVLSLPMYPDMQPEDQDYIIEELTKIISTL